jgi:hypothetical protein
MAEAIFGKNDFHQKTYIQQMLKTTKIVKIYWQVTLSMHSPNTLSYTASGIVPL